MKKPDHTAEARSLLALPRGSLGSLAERDGRLFPFVSLVLPAQSADGELILLLSDLSDHARNLQRDARASLLMDGTLALKEPLTGPRLTLIGEVHISPWDRGFMMADAAFEAIRPWLAEVLGPLMHRKVRSPIPLGTTCTF